VCHDSTAAPASRRRVRLYGRIASAMVKFAKRNGEVLLNKCRILITKSCVFLHFLIPISATRSPEFNVSRDS
jgi:hypothetical protein